MPISLSDPRFYIVRPFSKPPRTDLKDVFRVYLSPSTLLLHKLSSGDACTLQLPEEEDGPEVKSIPAIAWTAPERLQDNNVQTSKALQELRGLKLGDKVSIKALHEPITAANSVTLSEIPLADLHHPLAFLDEIERGHWAWFLEQPLMKAEFLCPGMTVNEIDLKGQKRSFKIAQIDSSNSPHALYRFMSTSVVTVRGGVPQSVPSAVESRSLLIKQDGIGGLTRQLDILNQRLAAYGGEFQRVKFPSYYRARRGGVLLYGPSGTGKSLLLRKVSEACWTKVYHIDADIVSRYGGNVDTAVARIFAEARRRQPSIVIIDHLETLAGKSRDFETVHSGSIAASLSEEFGRLGDSRILVLAATTNLSNIDDSLRRPGCFDLQIEIPIPDSKTRTEILKILSAIEKEAKVPILETLGDRTHGFVGADLDKLVQLGVEKAKVRTLATHGNDLEARNGSLLDNDPPSTPDTEVVVEVTSIDLEKALLEVRPTAMQEVFLETPKVRWTDIGGQHEVKKSLKQAVEWPFKVLTINPHTLSLPPTPRVLLILILESNNQQYPTDMARLGIEPKKGLLLYGPPGCSKTLAAKAVATEAGLNFIAVKGAELLSMYVGESERAMREVFRKARAASPSIIFFDEIDAIGASRESPGQHGGVNVLTTLLNELDGIEVLKGVFVLAATNKPEVLDPALMRPGRLDTILYVGPPDLEARKEIIQIRIAKMDVAKDMDAEWLADQTDGYSGAELVSICQGAGYAALEEQESTGARMQVCKRHFVLAFGKTQRQITREMAARYERWGKTENGVLASD